MLQNVMSSWRDVMTWRHDVILTCKAITGDIQQRNVILNSIQGSTKRVSHWATLQHVAIDAWRHDVSTWRQHDMESSYWRYFNCFVFPGIIIERCGMHTTKLDRNLDAMTNWICNQVSMLNSAWYSFTCHDDVMTSCHVLKGWRQHVVKWPNDLPL